jgi:hypothetical protein
MTEDTRFSVKATGQFRCLLGLSRQLSDRMQLFDAVLAVFEARTYMRQVYLVPLRSRVNMDCTPDMGACACWTFLLLTHQCPPRPELQLTPPAERPEMLIRAGCGIKASTMFLMCVVRDHQTFLHTSGDFDRVPCRASTLVVSARQLANCGSRHVPRGRRAASAPYTWFNSVAVRL